MKEKFPGRSSLEVADTYAHYWLGYTAAFDNLLSAWEEGVFTTMWPGLLLPLSGLLTCIK